jgi:hypothetical protein
MLFGKSSSFCPWDMTFFESHEQNNSMFA